MQSIWLVGINAKFAHTNPAIRYLKNYADNPAVGIAEYTINMPLESILNDLLNKGGKAYGFSVYIWNVDVYKRQVWGSAFSSISSIMSAFFLWELPLAPSSAGPSSSCSAGA